MRIYVVTFNSVEQLVEANTPSQAVMQVATGVISARPAKPQDVKRIMESGGKLFVGDLFSNDSGVENASA